MSETKKVFLLPGELHFTRKPAVISTVLGSCVAVCLLDGRNMWAGMNHYMLPNHEAARLPEAKCGDTAMALLLNMALDAGSVKTNLRAKIYGGGEVVRHLASAEAVGFGDIGKRNILLARSFLNFYDIPIVENETGGTQGRKIILDTATQEVECREIESSEHTKQLAAKRQRFKTALPRVLVVDDSRAIRKILRKGIEGSGRFDVVGEAGDPFEARERILELEPDIICLDIVMPRMNGYKFLKKLMAFKPIPTIAISTIVQDGSVMAEKMLKAGAVDVIDKEKLEIHRGYDTLRKVLIPRLERAALKIVKPIPVASV